VTKDIHTVLFRSTGNFARSVIAKAIIVSLPIATLDRMTLHRNLDDIGRPTARAD